MNSIIRTTAAAVATALVAGSVSAQIEPQEPRSQGQPSAQAMTGTMKVVRASQLQGAEVYGRDPEDAIGSVDMLLAEPMTGRLEFAVVHFDALDEGDVPREPGLREDDEMSESKAVVVPVRLLEPVFEEGAEATLERLRFTGAIDKVRSAPAFEEEQWNLLTRDNARTWCSEVRSHYGIQEDKELFDEDDEMERQPASGASKPGQKARPSGMMKLSELMDLDVEGSAGEDFDDIEELALDLTNGRILFFVVDMGGFLGIGETSYALPWKFASCGADDDGELQLTVPVTKEMLKSAPEFDAGQWRSATQPDYLQRLFSHYGVEPYWGKPMEAGYRKEKKMDDHGGGR